MEEDLQKIQLILIGEYIGFWLDELRVNSSVLILRLVQIILFIRVIGINKL
jgi:hypothetical protein